MAHAGTDLIAMEVTARDKTRHLITFVPPLHLPDLLLPGLSLVHTAGSLPHLRLALTGFSRITRRLLLDAHGGLPPRAPPSRCSTAVSR